MKSKSDIPQSRLEMQDATKKQLI